MTPLGAALAYAAGGWPVFPVALIQDRAGKIHKKPLIKWGAEATRDRSQLEALWPGAERHAAQIAKRMDADLLAIVVGLPTGERSGIVVLDIDVKPPKERFDGKGLLISWQTGFDTLADLDTGLAMLPETPMAHTGSGGLHLHFAHNPSVKIGISQGEKGIGPGLDVRGDGGYVVLPSPGSGYAWDKFYNYATVRPVLAQAWLGHREKAQSRPATASTGKRSRFDPHAFLAEACHRIRHAPEGAKRPTLREETFKVACLVREKFLTERAARHNLEAVIMPLGRHHDGNTELVEKDYENAFAEGLAAPSRRTQRRVSR